MNNSSLFDENMFKIFSFIDGNYRHTDTPGSGPDGDYEGSMRRPNWYQNQRSVYNGYKHIHGLHILSLMLPTGLNYIYGPNSARGGDHSAMLRSDLNGFLEEIQTNQFFDINGNPINYATHGDQLFTPDTCISRNHRPNGQQELTAQQKADNLAINFARITIEQSYAFMDNKHKILQNTHEFKLMNGNNPHAIQLLRVCMCVD